jgi:hypothetical protein
MGFILRNLQRQDYAATETLGNVSTSHNIFCILFESFLGIVRFYDCHKNRRQFDDRKTSVNIAYR